MNDQITRRGLLAAGAGAGLGAFAGSGVLEALAKTKPRAPGLDGVEHIVVFMQENRSFDSYFGTLRGVRGFDDPHALRLPGGRSVFHQPDPLNPDGYELPFHLDTRTTSAACAPFLSHAWDVQHRAWAHGAMDDWLPAHRAADGNATGPLTMGYYRRQDVPFYYALADAFTICDGYHASVIGPTDPNRLYMWTATIDPGGHHGGPVITNPAGTPSYTWTTYPERLQRAGISWRIYQQKDNFGDNMLALFKRFQDAPTSSPLYQRGMADQGPDAFAEDVARDRLPQISWIVAPAIESEHPPFTPTAGEQLTLSYLQALAAHPKVWRKTAFLLTWDENDGYFDHVRPPTPPRGTRNEFVGGLPIGLGFRVGMLVISPWSAGGYVCSQTFDHTSIIRLMEKRFGVREPNITPWRRRTCGDLTAAFGFGQHPRRFPHVKAKPPSVASTQEGCSTLPVPTVPHVQRMPKQEPGTRPRRGPRR